MNNRLQKLEELMESFQSFKKPLAFKGGLLKMPRITPSQWMVLRIISQHNISTVKDISETLNISSSAATQLVDGLVHSRYVVRKVNKTDRRKVTLTLSEKS
ncbi:MAG: MarR family transcriptional regulator, partial [Patescibacteria group bacterium]|nr:MarR family transcriptional regulator [Patescibacteria group bacterium]